MRHSSVVEKLSAFLGDELSAAEARELTRHLEACEACRLERFALERTVSLLRSLPRPEPPPAFARLVMERIRSGEAEPVSWWRQLFALPLVRPLAPVALVLAALFYFGGERTVTEPRLAQNEGVAGPGIHEIAADPLARPAYLAPPTQPFRGRAGLSAPLQSIAAAPEVVPAGWVPVADQRSNGRRFWRNAGDAWNQRHRYALQRIQNLSRSGRGVEAVRHLAGASHPHSQGLALELYGSEEEPIALEANWSPLH